MLSDKREDSKFFSSNKLSQFIILLPKQYTVRKEKIISQEHELKNIKQNISILNLVIYDTIKWSLVQLREADLVINNLLLKIYFSQWIKMNRVKQTHMAKLFNIAENFLNLIVVLFQSQE